MGNYDYLDDICGFNRKLFFYHTVLRWIVCGNSDLSPEYDLSARIDQRSLSAEECAFFAKKYDVTNQDPILTVMMSSRLGHAEVPLRLIPIIARM